MKTKVATFYLLLLFTALLQTSNAQTSALVSVDSNGKLIYTPDNKGNVVTDFSGV